MGAAQEPPPATPLRLFKFRRRLKPHRHADPRVVKTAVIGSLLADGFVNAVIPHLDRRAAFWFLIFSAALILLGQILLHAEAAADEYLLSVVGWHLIVIGIVGVAVMPKSPFWVAAIAAPIVLLSAYAN